ncbi:MAG: HD domain-containing phosphohydrolase, partial [Actinomycetota bacterium]
HLRLFRIGGRVASLSASVGVLYLGLSTLVWLGAEPYSVAWWGAHAADGVGVLLAAAGLGLAHRRDGSLVPTLAPVVNRDPLVALELGLTPVVHRFVAALSEKDPVTRHHVVRVGELAMRVGVRSGLDPDRLRALGLGALLHDIGKLMIPDAVLTKPGPLTDEEFRVMTTHTTWGFDLMSTSPLLAPAAPLVRWHHERVDGTGYPDGLSGDAIPVEAGLISVCDAFDAMTWSRPYRDGMAVEAALAVLQEGAGSQWDPRAVALVTAEITESGPVATPLFDRVGEGDLRAGDSREGGVVAVCGEALPAAARG